ncbi:MAG: hypothetical protein ABIH36_00540 [bacterium]
MIDLECERSNIEVDYRLSYSELATKLGANGMVRKIIIEDPCWCVINLPEADILNVEMCLYEPDHDVVGMQRAHRLLIQHSLRPALFHEAVALSGKLGNMFNWACLGVLWGPSANLYYRQLRGQRRLHLSQYSLGAKTIIPAVHFTGSWNRLPGMGI